MSIKFSPLPRTRVSGLATWAAGRAAGRAAGLAGRVILILSLAILPSAGCRGKAKGPASQDGGSAPAGTGRGESRPSVGPAGSPASHPKDSGIASKKTQAILRAIALGLDSYRQDFGVYPPSEPDRVEWTNPEVKVIKPGEKANDLAGFYGSAALQLYLNGRSGEGYSVKADTIEVDGASGPGDRSWPPRIIGVEASKKMVPAPRGEKYGKTSAGFLDAWGNEIEYFLAYRNRASWRSEGSGPHSGETAADIYPRAVNAGLAGAKGPYSYRFPTSGPEVLGQEIRIPAAQWFDEKFKDYRSGWAEQAAPVNAGRYLLVSPGPDGKFGTEDDIGNWEPIAAPPTQPEASQPPAQAPRAGRIQVQITRARMAAIGNACESYFQIFNAYPGVIDNPPTSNGTPAKLSGCQNLRLSLLGCSRKGTTYAPEVRGPAEDINRYADNTVRKYEPFLEAKKDELVKHNEVAWRDKAQDADYGEIEVLVDSPMPSPRPILYYRQLPRYVNQDLYEFDDNAVYCDPAKGETEEKFKAVLMRMKDKGLTPGFLVISAGPDRVFFTDDDIMNVLK